MILLGIAAFFLLFAAPPITLEDIAPRAGVDFVLRNGAAGNHYQIETMVSGVVAFDADGDGRTDLYFVNGEKKAPRDTNRLYRNRGDGTFEDITARAGLAGEGYGMGGAAADYDNDGDQDLFVAGVHGNYLYRNLGDGTFENVTAKAGLGDSTVWSVSAGWFDFDTDGDLDLFIVNYVQWSKDRDPPCTTAGVRTYCHPRYYTGLPNQLFRNNGDGTFTDVSRASGIGDHVGKGMGVAFFDFDGDGHLDVFVANDTVPNFLFRNERNGRFREMALQAGVAFNEDGRALSSMGADARDINNDGREDLWVTANANETFPLFLNLGRGLFRDETYPSGMGRSSMQLTGWSNGIFDFDNDGRKDLFAACGSIDANTERFSHRSAKLANHVFANTGDGKFVDVTTGVLQQPALHRGAAFADFDGDGRVDVAVSRIGEPAALFRNTSPGNRHWVALRLRGTRANRDGIGAMIHVRGSSGGEQWNRAKTAVGYGSSSDRTVHFGMRADSVAEWIEIQWPGGTVQTLKNVALDRVLNVTEEPVGATDFRPTVVHARHQRRALTSDTPAPAAGARSNRPGSAE
jgi:enediyne biosynthesis protein E4